MLEVIPDMMFRIRRDGTYTDVNTHEERDLVRPREEMLGRTLRDLLPSETAERGMEAVERALETHERQEFEYSLNVGSGMKYWEARMLPCSEDEVLAIVREITERKEQERELIRARKEALAAGQAKVDFLARMSHELRTPMTGVIGLLELLKESDLDLTQRGFAEMAMQSAQAYLGLLDDILDFSKIEAGKLSLERAPFLLEPCLADTLDLFDLPAKQKGLRLGFDLDPRVPSLVVGDSLRLREILINLLSNAVKFTQVGAIRVVVSVRSLTPGRADLLFEVEDTGIGIPPEKQKLIFEDFTQADPSTARVYGGSGLGLAICSRLVRIMGGEIGLRSEPGQGTVFHFTLALEVSDDRIQTVRPLSRDDFVDSPAGLPPADHKLSILLVEDDAINRLVTLTNFERRGHRVTSVSNGIEALQAVLEQSFDIIVLDVQLPGMDGMEVARRIRRMERTTGLHVPLLALTAHARAEDQAGCLKAGMDAYLRKPVRAVELLRTVESLASKSRPSGVRRLEGQPEESQTEESQTSESQTSEDSAVPRPLAVLNMERALAQVGSMDLFRQAIQSFLQELPATEDEIRRLVESADCAALQKSAHSLRGILAMLSAESAAAAARRLEQAAGRQRSRTWLRRLYLELQDEIVTLKERLAEDLPT